MGAGPALAWASLKGEPHARGWAAWQAERPLAGLLGWPLMLGAWGGVQANGSSTAWRQHSTGRPQSGPRCLHRSPPRPHRWPQVFHGGVTGEVRLLGGQQTAGSSCCRESFCQQLQRVENLGVCWGAREDSSPVPTKPCLSEEEGGPGPLSHTQLPPPEGPEPPAGTQDKDDQQRVYWTVAGSLPGRHSRSLSSTRPAGRAGSSAHGDRYPGADARQTVWFVKIKLYHPQPLAVNAGQERHPGDCHLATSQAVCLAGSRPAGQ